MTGFSGIGDCDRRRSEARNPIRQPGVPWDVFKFNRAFHVTVMKRFRGHLAICGFTPLMMPAPFASKDANKIEGYRIDREALESRFGLGPTSR